MALLGEFEAAPHSPTPWNPWLLVCIGPTPAHEEASNICLPENSITQNHQINHFRKPAWTGPICKQIRYMPGGKKIKKETPINGISFNKYGRTLAYSFTCSILLWILHLRRSVIFPLASSMSLHPSRMRRIISTVHIIHHPGYPTVFLSAPMPL